jgi:hypothetical protein
MSCYEHGNVPSCSIIGGKRLDQLETSRQRGQTRAGLRWRGPAATVNYKTVLSSERVLQNNKPATI